VRQAGAGQLDTSLRGQVHDALRLLWDPAGDLDLTAA